MNSQLLIVGKSTIGLLAILSFSSQLWAETFEAVCRSPRFSVTELTGYGTASARLVGLLTRIDLERTCEDPSFSQGTMNKEECMLFYEDSIGVWKIDAWANCKEKTYAVINDQLLQLSDKSCAGGGWYVEEALRILCPVEK